MAVPIPARNLHLAQIETAKPLNADFESEIIDFKEMNTIALQAVFSTAPPPDAFDGVFIMKVSLLCDPATFIIHPDSEKTMDVVCGGLGWSYCCWPWRYARLCFTAGTATEGTVDIVARGRRT